MPYTKFKFEKLSNSFYEHDNPIYDYGENYEEEWEQDFIYEYTYEYTYKYTYDYRYDAGYTFDGCLLYVHTDGSYTRCSLDGTYSYDKVDSLGYPIETE